MKISGVKSNKAISYGKRDKHSNIKKYIPSGRAILLSIALLSYPLKSDTYTNSVCSENLQFPICVEKTNNYVPKNMAENKEKDELSWEKIPDYQKLLFVFYSSLVLMLLTSLFTTKDKSSNSNKQDFN